MVESIKEYGILSPVIAREIEDQEELELLSGHNRVNAAKIIGLETVPTIIKNVDDDTAQIIVAEANFMQRQDFLPSERAKAYEMQLDALNRQGKKRESAPPVRRVVLILPKKSVLEDDNEKSIEKINYKYKDDDKIEAIKLLKTIEQESRLASPEDQSILAKYSGWGGIPQAFDEKIAFVTSKGTMDKQDNSVRKYIAERADLIGAIRLPNDTFKEVANTDVTTDILFLKKRDSINLEEPEWINDLHNDEGIPLNKYFIDNPHMMLGEMVFDEKRKGMFGENSKVTALVNRDEDFNIEESLKVAVSNLYADINKYNNFEKDNDSLNEANKDLPAEHNVKNFTFTIINGNIYYRENASMKYKELGAKTKERIIKLHEIRQEHQLVTQW